MEPTDILESAEMLDRQEFRECPEPLVIRVRSDRQDLLDSRDHRVLQEVPDFKDHQDLRAPQVIQE